MLRFCSLLPAAFLLVAFTATAAFAESPIAGPSTGKLLDYHAYAAWRSIRETRLSRDGRWVAYASVPAEADGELVVRETTGSATLHAARGRSPEFSADGRFVVFRIAAPFAEVRAAEYAQKPADQRPKDGYEIVPLPSGTPITIDRVRSAKLSDRGATLALLVEPSPAPSASPTSAASVAPIGTAAPTTASPTPSPLPSPHGPGKPATTSLNLRRLETGEPAHIANVSAYAVSADGSRVAYVVQTASDESLHVRAMADGDDRVIVHGTAHLAGPILSPDGAKLAYLSDATAYAEPTPKKEPGARAPYALMIADVVTGGITQAIGGADARIASDAVPLEFSRDGATLAFAIADRPLPRPSAAPPRVEVDFWYARDGALPTQLRHDAQSPKHGAHLSIYDLAAKKITRLETPAVPQVEFVGGAPYALGITNLPYVKRATYDETYVDLERIDVATGARMRLATNIRGNAALSPTGAYVAGYDPQRRAWYTLRMRDGRKTWVTDPRVIHAAREDDDHPGAPPSYGSGGWAPDDAVFLVYDRYDVWAVAPDGGPVRSITRGVGRATKRIYRVSRFRTDEPRGLFVPRRPAYTGTDIPLTFLDDRTKAMGFAAGSLETAPRVTQMSDALVGTALRARDAARVVYTQERFDRFPDLWTAERLGAPAVRVSDANPQAAQYAWGRSRLIDYTNARGEKLRAILTTPDHFDAKRKYPMLVYVYEKMTDDLNRYVQPESGTVVNLARYANHGYVVLQPDIRYQVGHTTASAVDCVASAVKRVVSLGFVDPQRIGMAGHSYGGYEVNALVTHTTLFRAVESGASDSDLVSLYGGFWESGDVQQSYYETGQGRIGATPWARPDLYIENSPIYFVDRVRAPYLRIQDDKDGFVPYGQGVEFFTALRRAGKEAYMFSFIGENHGLAKQANKDYWTVHLDEFFDHFLLGMPTPAWMKQNDTFEHRGERDIDSLFTPAAF